jgi:hypothetical protein
MAASATNTFTMAGLIPAFSPWTEAKRINVTLPVSVTYPKGTLIGEVVGNNEVQTLTLATGGTLGGTYTVSFGGVTSAAIAFNASAATVQTALEAVATIGTGNVAVSGTTPTTSGGTLVFTFQNQLGFADVPLATLGVGSLTGNSGSAIALTTSGASGSKGTSTLLGVTIGGSGLGGTFTLTYGGVTSGAIPYNATSAQIQTYLDAMSTLGVGSTEVQPANTSPIGGSGGTFLIRFTGSKALATTTTLTGSNSGLTGTSPTVTITTIVSGAAGTSASLWKAYNPSGTDGSQFPRAILEFDCATDASGNITLGGASGGGDKQQYAVGNTCSAFVSGTFRTEDLFHGPGVGVIDTNALTVGLGRLIEGTLTNGAIRVG